MMDTPRLPPHGHSTLKALLVLEDGAHFWGTSVGAVGETFGELVFETGMTGYGVLTDSLLPGKSCDDLSGDWRQASTQRIRIVAGAVAGLVSTER